MRQNEVENKGKDKDDKYVFPTCEEALKPLSSRLLISVAFSIKCLSFPLFWKVWRSLEFWRCKAAILKKIDKKDEEMFTFMRCISCYFRVKNHNSMKWSKQRQCAEIPSSARHVKILLTLISPMGLQKSSTSSCPQPNLSGSHKRTWELHVRLWKNRKMISWKQETSRSLRNAAF